jgi:hypothetical protein
VIDLAKVPKNTVLVSVRGVVHKDWHNKRIFSKFVNERYAYMLKNGYLNEFTWVTNPYSLKIMTKAGTKIWKDMSFELKG